MYQATYAGSGEAWRQSVITRSNRNLRSGQKRYSARILLFAWLLLVGIAAFAADSREALQKAANLVQEGRLKEADEQAHLALSDPDTRAAACSVLGTIRLQQKRFAESVTFFQEAIRLEPKLMGARLSLADVYTVQGKPQLALGLYQQILDLDPSNTPARLAMVRSESEMGNYQRSLDLAAPMLTSLKQTPEGICALAADFVGLGDHTSLAALAKDWAGLSNPPQAWSIKFGVLLARGGAIEEAAELLEHVQQTGPPSYELAFNLAGVYLLKKNPALALDYYDQAIGLKPESLPALKQAAAVAEGQGEFERALSYWIRAKKAEPENPEILLGFGRVCLEMDLLEDAEPALEKAAKKRPKDASYQYTLASAKVGKKQFDVAQSILEGLLEKQPQDSHLQYALGSVLYLEGHLADAATHLRESIRLQPDQLASYYYLALVARDQGDEADAIHRLEDLLRRYPDHAPSCEVLGGLLMTAQRYPEAESNLERAVRLNPKSVKANYQLGLLLARMGNKVEADKRLEMAKSLRTEDEAHSRLQLRLLDPDQ